MKLISAKKNFLTVTAFLFVGAIFSLLLFPPSLFFNNRILIAKLNSEFANGFKGTGLKIQIRAIRWNYWDRIVVAGVRLTDGISRETPLAVDKITVKISLFDIITKRRHPEECLREIELVNPKLSINRLTDGSWDFERYFAKKRRELKLKTILKIKNGDAVISDYHYGAYRLRGVGGLVDLRNYPEVDWHIKGDSKIGALAWQLNGQARIDRRVGQGKLILKKLPLRRVTPFLPAVARFEFKTGLADAALNLVWVKNRLALEKGTARIRKADVFVPGFRESLLIKDLRARFTPSELWIGKSRLMVRQATITALGRLNLNRKTVQMELKANRFDLALLAATSQLREYQPSGMVDLRLKVSGALSAPLINGVVYLRDARFAIDRENTVNHISGKINIVKNDLQVEKAEGFWRNSTVNLSGKISHMLNPDFDLHIKIAGLDLKELSAEYLKAPGLRGGGELDFSGNLRGAWKAPRLAGVAKIAKINYRDLNFTGVTAELIYSFAAAELKIVSIRGELWGGRIAAGGKIKRMESTVSWDLAGTLDGIEAARTDFGGKQGIKGGFSAEAYFKGNWVKGKPFNPGAILGSFQGEKVGLKGAFFEKAQGIFSWNGGILNLDSLRLESGGGKIFGDLTWRRSAVSAAFNAEGVRLRNLFPDTKRYPFDGFFNGDITVDGPPDRLTARARGKFEKAAWSSREIGCLVGELIYHNGTVEISGLNVKSKPGDLTVDGRIFWEKEPNLQLTLNGKNIKLKEFLEWFPVDSRIKIDGLGSLTMNLSGAASNPALSCAIDLEKLRFGNFLMDRGQIEAEGDFNQIRIKNFQLVNAESKLDIDGVVNRGRLDLNFKGHLTGVEKLELYYKGSILKGDLEMEGTVAGSPSNPEINMLARGYRIAFGGFLNQTVTARLKWKAPVMEIIAAEIESSRGVLNVSGKVANRERVELDLSVKAEKFGIQELSRILNFKWLKTEGKLTGLAQIGGTVQAPTVKMNGALIGAAINGFPVTGEFNLFYARNNLQIEKVELRHGGGVVQIGGSWESGRRLKIAGHITGFPLAMLRDYPGNPLAIDGTADADLKLEWSEDAGVTGQYQVSVAEFQINQDLLGSLSLGGSLSENGIKINNGAIMNNAGFIRIDGELPWPEKMLARLKFTGRKDLSRKLDLSFNLKNFPAIHLNLAKNIYTASQGQLNGKLRLIGPPDDPRIFGEINCNNVALDLPRLPLTVNSFQAAVSIDNNKAVIKKAQGNVRKGKINIGGAIIFKKLKPDCFNLELTGAKFYYRNRFFDGYADFSTTLTGPFDRPLISGLIQVYNCKIGFAGGKTNKTGNWQPELDLTVKSGKDVRYRQVGFADITVKGAIKISGCLFTPAIAGEVDAVNGVLSLYGQSFKVTRGTAVFKPSQSIKPFIDVESNLRTAKAEIFLTVKGQVGPDLALTLTSQPYLAQDEIFALLNWPEFRGDKPLTVNGVVGNNLSIVTDSLFGDFFHEIRSKLDLDYLNLETDYSNNDLRIKVGDYVTDQLYLSYSRSIVTDQPNEDWGIDYNLTPNILAGGAYSKEDGTSWRLTYRIKF